MFLENLIVALVSILLYAWVGYPLLLAIFARICSSKSSVGDSSSRFVTVVVAAHNEASVIKTRIRNILDQFEGCGVDGQILIGSDASSDMTVALASEFVDKHDNVKVFEFSERRGKVAVLKDLIRSQRSEVIGQGPEDRGEEGKKEPQINADERGSARSTSSQLTNQPINQSSTLPPEGVYLFTDANTEFERGALGRLLERFEDPEVGGVCGKLVFVNNIASHRGTENTEKVVNEPDEMSENASPSVPSVPAPALHRAPALVHGREISSNSSPAPSEGIYWKLENWMKERESSLDSCLGANGAIYAVRSECFWDELPENTIVDDFVIGMKVRQQGKRMVYEPGAVAYEEFPEVSDEWKRRVRIGSGDYQALMLCGRSVSLDFGWFAWSFFSHKVLRWFTPHLILLLWVLSFFSTGRQGGYFVFMGTFLLIAAAFIGRVFKESDMSCMRIFKLCDHFVTMQMALFVGFIRFCKGDLTGKWERTPRS